MSGPIDIHGSCIAIGGRGLLLLGRPGAGKSDLALRLIAAGAALVADDRVRLEAIAGTLMATPNAALAGRLEARGVGLLTLAHLPQAPLALALALDEPVPRLPEPAEIAFLGLSLPKAALAPFEASAPLKARHLLDLFGLPAPGNP